MSEPNKRSKGGYKHNKEGLASIRATSVGDLNNLHAGGMTLRQIANQFGVSTATVENIFKRNGLAKGSKHDSEGVKAFKAIPLAKIQELYLGGMSSLELGKQYKVGHTVVLRWLEKNGIQRRWHDEGAVFKNLKMLIPLSPRQEQLMLGSLLGDACLSRREYSWKSGKQVHAQQLCFSHGHAQLDYLKHKRCVLLEGREGLPKSCVSKLSLSGGSGSPGHWGGDVFQFAFSHTPTLDRLEDSYKLRNMAGKVYVSEQWANAVDALGLTYWFLDDGCLQTTHANKAHSLSLATCAYDSTELELLLGIVRRLGAPSACLNFCRTGQYVIKLSKKQEVLRLRELMLPHTPECMLHKLKQI